MTEIEPAPGSYRPDPHAEELERTLALRARDGDSGAFDELDRRIRPDLRRYLASKLRANPQVDVDDAVQDTFLYVFDRLTKGLYLEEYPFRVFVFALARRIVARRLDRRVGVNREISLSSLESPDEPGEGIDLHAGHFEGFAAAFSHVAGVHRFDAVELSDVFRELLATFYAHGGYPHQQLAFGYSLLLWGRAGRKARASGPEGKVPVTGDSRKVVTRCGPTELSPLAGRFSRELSGALGVAPEWLTQLQQPLTDHLEETLGALTEGDSRSRKVYEPLLDRVTGGTKLDEYFGRKPEESVANWTRQVKDRVRRVYLHDAEASRTGEAP